MRDWITEVCLLIPTANFVPNVVSLRLDGAERDRDRWLRLRRAGRR